MEVLEGGVFEFEACLGSGSNSATCDAMILDSHRCAIQVRNACRRKSTLLTV